MYLPCKLQGFEPWYPSKIPAVGRNHAIFGAVFLAVELVRSAAEANPQFPTLQVPIIDLSPFYHLKVGMNSWNEWDGGIRRDRQFRPDAWLDSFG
jgi:hypothetical protein